MLALLEGKRRSRKFRSAFIDRIVGLITCDQALFGKTTKWNFVADGRGYSRSEGKVETECCAVDEKGCGQAINIARAT